jgi:excisionase family DNA binding protein
MLEAGQVPDRQYVSIDTLCRLYELNKKTVRNWTSARKIPYHKIRGLVRFNIGEIERWLKTQQVNTIVESPVKLTT